MLEAVKWAAGGKLSAGVEAPLWVTTEAAEQPREGLLLVHLLNYKPAEPVSDINVRLRVPAGKRIVDAYYASPDPGASAAPGSRDAIPVQQEDGTVRLRIPRLKIYDMVVMWLE